MASPIPNVPAAPTSGGGYPSSIPKTAPTLPIARTTPSSLGYHEVATQINNELQAQQSEFRLQVDGGSGRTVFSLVQTGTGVVLLQIPSAELLGLSRRVKNIQSKTIGSLVDTQS